MQSLVSIAKVGANAAAGAFFGAFTLNTFPSTWDEWKHVLAPALAAAAIAEAAYLRSQYAAIKEATDAAIKAAFQSLQAVVLSAVDARLSDMNARLATASLTPPPIPGENASSTVVTTTTTSTKETT